MKPKYKIWVVGRSGEYFGCVYYDDREFVTEPQKTRAKALVFATLALRRYLSNKRRRKWDLRKSVFKFTRRRKKKH